MSVEAHGSARQAVPARPSPAYSADGICKPANRPLGTPCDDSSLCSTGDVCNGLGACGGTPKVCNDGSVCTADSCVAATGQCQNTASSCSVTPLGACTMAGAAGSPPVAVFGYVNGEATNTEMVHGPNNQLTPVKLQGRQPRWFKPGTHENAFSLPIEAGQTINWTLGSQTVEASAAILRLAPQVRWPRGNSCCWIDCLRPARWSPPRTWAADRRLAALPVIWT